jgi:hypothetical protein
LASVGGALGFSSLLTKLEAAAEGAGSPPRFLLMFWPNGVVPYLFLPTTAGSGYVSTKALLPFEAAGLRQDTTVLYGLKDVASPGGGGGPEAGTVLRTTCANVPGTRANGGEADDAVAGGPSIDQILLRRVPALMTGFAEPVNAICDARVDSKETSAQCLSYSYEQRSVTAAVSGEPIIENVPLMPELSPAKLYARLFSGFMPGGVEARPELANALRLRKSVLDYSLGELRRLRSVAPARELEKLDAHAEAIRGIEKQLAEQLAGPLPGCELPSPPDPGLTAQSGSYFDYIMPEAAAGEDDSVAELGRLHLGVIRAAFQCDITRVATFQWSSAADRVAFKGLYPGEPDTAYRHHPMSHRISGTRLEQPPDDQRLLPALEFQNNVKTWYNERTAEALLALKSARDIFGGSLLDHTIVPYVTDTADLNHARSPLAAMLFGGRALGFKGGQFLDYRGALRPFADLWLSVAQALLPSSDVRQVLGSETFMLQHGEQVSPLAGIWEAPG